MTETIIAHFVAYDESATVETEVDEDGQYIVSNHDELVDAGQTHEEIRALAATEQNRDYLSEHMIVTEGDPLWRDEFAEMESGDVVKLTDTDTSVME